MGDEEPLDELPAPPKPHCRNCRHFYLTYSLPFAYGCRGLEMKTKIIPWDAVRLESGMDCLYHEDRPRPKPSDRGNDEPPSGLYA